MIDLGGDGHGGHGGIVLVMIYRKRLLGSV